MKRVLLGLLVFSFLKIYGQIELIGDSYYKFVISGYQGIDPNACGNMYGLREINLSYSNGDKENLWYGRIVQNQFILEKLYSKNKKITAVEIYSINRWQGCLLCGCNSGPNHDKSTLYINSTCFNQFYSNPVHVTKNVTVKTFPIYNINFNNSTEYILSSDKNLKISLLDNLDNNDYIWKYKIGGGQTKYFSHNYNNKHVLNIPAKEFINESDFGKVISVWVESNCLDGGNVCKSNIFTFVTYSPSPHISTHTVYPVTCSDSEDGKIRLNFDRTLKTGETLEFTLTNTDTGVIVNNYDVTAALRAGTSYSIEDLAPGKYKLNLRGTYNGKPTYTDGSQHSVEFEVKKPDPVGFSLTSQTNVFCFGGNDGAFRIDGTGGQNSYQYSLDNGATWVNFSHTQHTIITGLSAGTYNVKVRDTNHCMAKNNRGNDKVITVNITEPTKAIAFSDIENVQPKGHGLSNGYISVRVTGGTPFADGSYHYEWRKDSPTGAVMPSSQITTDKTTHPFTIVLKNIPAGKYYLTVKDKNHAGATSNLQNCGIISREFIVTQPDPLIANIMQEQGISCHKDNNDAFKLDANGNGINDNAEDGSIKAQVRGGVGGYQYQWQKEVGGVFTNISGATRNILENLTAGKYKLIVKDRNNNTTSAVFQLNFPSQLKINLSSTTLKCNGLEDGKVTVSATGGTGGYTYLWNTLDTSPVVEGLGAGNYFVTVTDSKSCSVKGSIKIEQPGQLEITDVDIKNPVCHGAANGKISVRASGGRAPYSLVWSNGMTGETISGLRAGKYVLTFTDANGCHMTKEYILTNPEEFTVDLGGDITLCAGDSKEYDITVSDRTATYQWKDANGRVISTNPKIRISQVGTYTAIITNAKGCIATDQITVRNSTEELHPHMMLSTQAYVERTVKLVNTSNPRPQRVEWIVPRTSQVQVIEQNDDYLEVKFHSTGSYNFGLKGHQGACEKIFYKNVVVEENLSGVDIDPERTSNIKEFTIVPNPNNGEYKVIVKLYEEADIKLRIIDMVSHEPFAPVLRNRSINYEIPFNQPTLPAGTYLIILETKGESQVKKMLVN